jgi:hypothetical protein
MWVQGYISIYIYEHVMYRYPDVTTAWSDVVLYLLRLSQIWATATGYAIRLVRGQVKVGATGALRQWQAEMLGEISYLEVLKQAVLQAVGTVALLRRERG